MKTKYKKKNTKKIKIFKMNIQNYTQITNDENTAAAQT